MKNLKSMFWLIALCVVALCATPAFAGGSFFTGGGVNQYAFTNVTGYSPTLYQEQSLAQHAEIGLITNCGNYIPIVAIDSNQGSYMQQTSFSYHGGVSTEADTGSSYQIGVGGGMGMGAFSTTYSAANVSTWGNSSGNANAYANQTVTVGP